MADESIAAMRGRAKRTTYVAEETWTKFGEFKAAIIGRKGENAVARTLAALGIPALHDVLLPDLLGITQLDHVVRAADAILVIETKTYGGHIAGSLHSSEWVQHLAAGETQHAFQNPVHQNHRHCRAVEATIAGLDVPVAGVVVSAGSATFCEALQGCVVPLRQLGEVFRPTPGRHHDPRHLEVAWQRLVTTTADTEPRREEHRNSVRERRNSADGAG